MQTVRHKPLEFNSRSAPIRIRTATGSAMVYRPAQVNDAITLPRSMDTIKNTKTEV